MSIETVRTKILNAWRDLPLIPANEIAYSADELDFERDAVAQFFAGKHWRDVSWVELQKYDGDCSACLSFMSPAAYRYYLPVYMFVALDHYRESDVSADSAWLSLSPPTDATFVQHWADRVAGFSTSQRDAVLSFFEFMIHEHGNDYTYDRERLNNAVSYWGNTL